MGENSFLIENVTIFVPHFDIDPPSKPAALSDFFGHSGRKK